MQEFKADLAGLNAATAFLTQALSTQVPDAARRQLMVAADEVLSNVVHYSGAASFGIGLRLDAEAGTLEVEFSDDGAEFDPLSSAATPDVTLSAAERPIGGLGIFMVRKLMDRVEYEHRGGRNVLRVTKRWGA